MSALLDRIGQWRSSHGAALGGRVWFVGSIALGVLLLAFGAVRTASSVRTRARLTTDVSNLIADRADLEDALLSGLDRDQTEGSDGFDLAIPFGGVPGPILEEILATLESVGIRDFEYKLRERGQTIDGRDPRGNDGTRDDISEDDGGDEVWGSEDWEEEEQSDDSGANGETRSGPGTASAEITPGLSLYHWKIDLVLRTEYSRVIELLGALAGAPRRWRVSEVGLTRVGGSLEGRLLLETFTRPTPEDETLGDVGPCALNDPFHVTSRQTQIPLVPTAPSLRAVVSGSAPRAWIGDQILRTGESVAQWTVEEIDDNGVWIRHSSGQRVRLSVGG